MSNKNKKKALVCSSARNDAERCADDGGVRFAFDKKIRHSQSGFFDGLRFFSIVLPLMIAVSIYVMVTAKPENMTGLIAVPLTALVIGIIWGIFLICHIIEFSFVTSGDRLFIAYDGEGNPYSVEVGEKRIRVLYQNLLYVIKDKRIKKINNERKLYYAYLSMFPQSVLSMEKYVDNSDRSTEPVIIPSINYYDDGRCTLSFGEFRFSQTQSLPEGYGSFYPKSLLRHLNFYKYIFTVNNELKITSVYSASRENAILGYDIVTFAELSESGDAAKETLRKIITANKLLENVLYKIDKSF